MSISHGKGSWLEQVAQLLGEGKARERRPIRRLAAEHLERRNVLCTVAAVIAPAGVPDETILPELRERAAAMGPVQPVTVTEGPATMSEDSTAGHDDSASDPGFADQYFATYAGQGGGEGEGNGSGSGSGGGLGSGSGSGGGTCSGSGSGVGECSGSGSGGGEGSGSGSGGGEGSGSGGGEGSGSGSGGGEEEENQAPSISVTYLELDGVLYFSGTVSDDGTLGGLTVKFGDLIIQDTLVDQFGHFSFQVPSPQNQGQFSFSVTDDHGLGSGINHEEYNP